jgi:UTP--glucose-1-phosphate uridylyltransferase
MEEVKKVIIPAAGLGTRFLPLTKALPKELLPLVDRPLIDYAVNEAKTIGASQVIFVISESKKNIMDYFKKNQRLENLLKKNEFKKEALMALQEKEKEFEGLSFSYCVQPFPKGDGDALWRAKNYIKRGAFAVLFPDDVIESKISALSQLMRIYATSQKPVVALKEVQPDKIPSYGMALVEKIANRLYKIKKIVEKPSPDKIESNLVIVGRYILTPEIFTYLKKTAPNEKGEVILTDALNLAIEDGKIIYGYEIGGEWLECGKTIDWLKSNVALSLKHPVYGPVLGKWLKKNL